MKAPSPRWRRRRKAACATALSLLDQVIAACGGRLDEKRVRQVLGVVPTDLLADIVEAVDAADARRVLEQVGQLAIGRL